MPGGVSDGVPNGVPNGVREGVVGGDRLGVPNGVPGADGGTGGNSDPLRDAATSWSPWLWRACSRPTPRSHGVPRSRASSSSRPSSTPAGRSPTCACSSRCRWAFPSRRSKRSSSGVQAAMLDQRPVSVYFTLTVKFELQSRRPPAMQHPVGGRLRGVSISCEINVAPLVDVCLVLLIIFMVVTPMLVDGVDVALPETQIPERMPKRLRSSSMSRSGTTAACTWRDSGCPAKSCRRLSTTSTNDLPTRTWSSGRMPDFLTSAVREVDAVGESRGLERCRRRDAPTLSRCRGAMAMK